MSQSTRIEELPAFPMMRTCPHQPPSEYAEFRESGEMVRVRMYDGRVAWLVTRYEDVRELLLRNDVLSVNRDNPAFPIPAEREGQFPDLFRQIAGLDGEAHHTRRKMLIPRFTVRQVEKLRPRIQQATDELLDKLLADGPPVDLLTAFARPLPSRVISDVLGVPHEEYGQFEQYALGIMEAPTLDEALEAGGNLLAYLDRVVEAKQDAPGDDLLTTLVHERMNTGEIPREDMAKLAVALQVAGHETTASMIALGTLTLLENPDQAAQLRSDPNIAPGVTDELLRYLAIADLTTIRVATADFDLNGQPIKAGQGLILSQAAANRDARAFADPDVVDVRREARTHLSFGVGVHRCLGEHLARAELQIAYATLFTRVPTLALAAPLEQIPIKFNQTLEGVQSLPVTW